jgi:hypothetical protein
MTSYVTRLDRKTGQAETPTPAPCGVQRCRVVRRPKRHKPVNGRLVTMATSAISPSAKVLNLV